MGTRAPESGAGLRARYATHLEARAVSPQTRRAYLADLDAFLRWAGLPPEPLPSDLGVLGRDGVQSGLEIVYQVALDQAQKQLAVFRRHPGIARQPPTTALLGQLISDAHAHQSASSL